MTTMNVARTEKTNIEPTEVISLEHGAIYRLPYGAVNIRVLNGTAWITSQAEDHILKADGQLLIPRQQHVVLISSAGHQPLQFEMDMC